MRPVFRTRLDDRARLHARGGAFRVLRERRRFVEGAESVRVLPEITKRARRAVGIREGRNGGPVKNCHRFRHTPATQETGEDRFAFEPGERCQPRCHLVRMRHRLRRQDDEQAIVARIARHDFDGARIAFRIRIADDIDGIAVTPVRRQHQIERGHAFTRQTRALTAIRDQGVGREHTGAATIGHDRKPRTARAGLFA